MYKEAFIGMAVQRGLHLCNTGEISTVVIDNGISGLLCHDGVSAVRLFYGISLDVGRSYKPTRLCRFFVKIHIKFFPLTIQRIVSG